MKVENQAQLNRKLIGYFMFDGIGSSCLIADFSYSRESLDYCGDDESPQSLIPIDAVGYNLIPAKYYELGYIPAGVIPVIEFENVNCPKIARYNANCPEIDEYIDLPVYETWKYDNLQKITIEFEEKIPAVDIIYDEDGEPQLHFQIEECGSSINKNYLERKLFGCVTATSGGILICDMEYIGLCRSHYHYKGHQIIVPAGDTGFRAGVVVIIPEELQDREFPVYGEYEGELLKRIAIEIANSNS